MSPQLVTVVAHVGRSDLEALDQTLATVRRQRRLGDDFVFHYGRCRPAVREAFFLALRDAPVTAHARIVDKRTWLDAYIRGTSGDGRIRLEIVELILGCPDEVVAKQVLMIDGPKSETRRVVAIKTALNQALATRDRAGFRLVKLCADDHRSQGAVIQVADMIAGALHDAGDFRSPYFDGLRRKIQVV